MDGKGRDKVEKEEVDEEDNDNEEEDNDNDEEDKDNEEEEEGCGLSPPRRVSPPKRYIYSFYYLCGYFSLLMPYWL
jgi:hypothetical protein